MPFFLPTSTKMMSPNRSLGLIDQQGAKGTATFMTTSSSDSTIPSSSSRVSDVGISHQCFGRSMVKVRNDAADESSMLYKTPEDRVGDFFPGDESSASSSWAGYRSNNYTSFTKPVYEMKKGSSALTFQSHCSATSCDIEVTGITSKIHALPLLPDEVDMDEQSSACSLKMRSGQAFLESLMAHSGARSPL